MPAHEFFTSLGYHAGTTRGVTPPTSFTFTSGLSVAFSTGAAHKLQRGAVIQDITAMHVSVGHYSSSGSEGSISTQIAALRRLLLGTAEQNGEEGYWWSRVREVCDP